MPIKLSLIHIFYDNRPARVAESRALSDGTESELTAAAYAYERSPLMERGTKTVTAAGSGQEQTSVEETYGEAAAYPYACLLYTSRCV